MSLQQNPTQNPKMSFKILPGTKDDLPEFVEMLGHAMSQDPFWRAMKGPNCTFEEECAFLKQMLVPRSGPGAELGAQQTWKAVDENG